VLLPDHEIRRLCRQEAMVVPFNEDLLNPASLDVTLGGTILVEVTHTRELEPIDITHHTEADPFWMAPGEFFLAETQEIFNLPDHVGAQFVLKSSRAREGWDHAEAGWCDPGWYGSRLTMELKNGRRHHSLPIWPGMKVGQMKFLLVSGRVERSYAVTGRYNADLAVTASKG
jgi:dCTP deaminase